MNNPDNSTIKAFCIDLNWDALCRAASPGLYVNARAEDHVRWYRDLGANTIQTFCVAYNGFAWFPSDVAPTIPGLRGNFLQEQVELGHRHGMRVMGYFCLGSNTHWETWCAPNEVHRDSAGMPLVLTEKYLDYFCACVREALEKNDIDGFMIDWINRNSHEVWLDCEKHMWQQLMGEAFPANGVPTDAEILEFDRRSIDRAWVRIKQAVDSTRKTIIWTNHPFRMANDPLWNGQRVLKEVDWVLNEAPNLEFLAWLEGQIGPQTKIIQNICGWCDHDSASALAKLDFRRFGLYGFATAHPQSTLPWTIEEAEALESHISKEKNPPAYKANAQNILHIRKFFHSL